MDVRVFETPEDIGSFAASLIMYQIQTTDGLLLCAATGNSTTAAYEKLAENSDRFGTETVRVLKLDEWGGIPMSDPQSCETYLREKLIGPLNIEEDNYTGFQSDSEDPGAECKRIREFLEDQGPIDLLILGLGMNGHIAFNEPSEVLNPHAHVATLSEMSMTHPMAFEMNVKPTYGLTLGMVDIMSARQILLLVHGIKKAEMMRELLSRKITTSLPASLLWLHHNAHLLCDRDAFSLCNIELPAVEDISQAEIYPSTGAIL